MKHRARLGVVAVSGLFLAASAIAYGCGGDDSAASDDSNANDSGPGADGTISDGAPGDSATCDSAPGTDATVDAAPAAAHIVFLTADTFTGDLIGQANAIDADAGLDGGFHGDAGDAGTDYLHAADAICQHEADSAGLKGTFAAMIRGGSDAMFSRFTDADGPWARVDGTPVADTAQQLSVGDWSSTIDLDQHGNQVAIGFAWGDGNNGADCAGWSSASGTIEGAVGSFNDTAIYAFANTAEFCSTERPIYCAEVGAGGGPLHRSPVPSGGKIAFYSDVPLFGNFALPDAGVVDGSAPTGDLVHGVADDICNQVAKGNARAGTYHAWVSSAAVDAKTYFTSLSMNGPWYRPDGAELAASLDELVATGVKTQLEFRANGLILVNPGMVAWTGTSATGTASNNCADFTSLIAPNAVGGLTCYKGSDFTSGNGLSCNGGFGLYCVQE